MSTPPAQHQPSRTVWIARHGNRADFVDKNWRHTAERPHDPPLSPDGEEQARRLGARLTGEGIAHVFASPFLRTVQTAHHIAEALNLPLHLELGMCEWLQTEWYGETMPDLLPPDLLARTYPRINPAYRSDIDVAYPENDLRQCYARTRRAVHHLLEKYEGDLLLVGHGASVDAATYSLVDESNKIHSGLCCIVKIVQEGDAWRLAIAGDQSHLEDAERELRFQ